MAHDDHPPAHPHAHHHGHDEPGGGQAGGHATVDINTASRDELLAVTGIGRALADRIVEERPFADLEELRVRVRGVPRKLLEELRARGVKAVGFRRPKQVVARLTVELVLPDNERRTPVAIHVFDEDGNRLCGCAAGSNEIRFEVPDTRIGHMLTFALEPGDRHDHAVSLDVLAARNVPIVRAPFIGPQKAIDLGRIVFDPKHFKRSCCRVRGRVVRRVRLPNGRTVTRPLCNARVAICEVDVRPFTVVARLPDDLLRRLAEEVELIPIPRPDPPPLVAAARAGRAMEVAPQLAGTRHMTQPIDATHAHTFEADPPIAALAPETTATATFQRLDTTTLRATLLERIDLIKLHWCRFPWLHGRYQLDCLKTVAVDSVGRFDTDISYPCYGDRPDLYFKVEQRCGAEDWRTVHAPSIACSTHWDYCCGDEVEIVVTDTTAGLGTLIEPWAPPVYSPSDPASVGSWQLLPYTSQIFVVHAAVMWTGKVLMFSGGVEGQLPLESRVWDPVTGAFTAHSFTDDLFCAFQVVLGDGRVLVMGGSNYNGPHGRGIDVTYTFDPGSPGWVKHADMTFGRWYPTAIVMPDGSVLAVSGRAAGGPVVGEIEWFDPSTNVWSTLPSSATRVLDIYPSLHLMASGKVFYTGTRWEGGFSSPRPWIPPHTALFDPATNTWADVGPHVIPNRTEGTSVLLPPRASAAHHHGHGEEMPPPGTLTRVVVLGGDCGSPAERSSAEVIDLATPAPAWQRIPDMHHRRVNPNAVLLADGSMLVCAGITGFKWDPDPGRVLEAEILDTQSLTWSRAAVMTEGRQYHSVSLLLPDGRVLNTGSVGGSGGGTNLTSMEVFSPPYLFRGPRPRITAYPTTASYGTHFTITTPDACRIRRAALVRPGAPTHHTDSDQRYVPLEFHREGACDLHLHVPESAAVVPPGYYLLFLLDDADVPSEGKFVRIG